MKYKTYKEINGNSIEQWAAELDGKPKGRLSDSEPQAYTGQGGVRRCIKYGNRIPRKYRRKYPLVISSVSFGLIKKAHNFVM